MHKILMYCSPGLTEAKKPMHFCFIADTAYGDFKAHFPDTSLQTYLSRWFEEDFNEKPDFTTWTGLNKAKGVIIKNFQGLVPFLNIDNIEFDRFGMLRYWVHNHIYAEISKEEKNGTENIGC